MIWKIINNIRVSIVSESEPERNVNLNLLPAYINTSGKMHGDGEYLNIFSVTADEEKRKAMLKRAAYELKLFQNKYSTLKELAKVLKAITETEEELKEEIA